MLLVTCLICRPITIVNDMRACLLALYAIKPNVRARSKSHGDRRPPCVIPISDGRPAMTAHVTLPSISPAGADLARRADVAAEVAAAHADAVDRQARFPAEAFATLRAERLMSILV